MEMTIMTTANTDTTTYFVRDINTAETVGIIEMTDLQHADYTAAAGHTGAIGAAALSDYGDVTELTCDSDATVYVAE